MFNEITKTIQWGNTNLEISTGKIARQSDGAVMVKMGKSAVLCAVDVARKPKEGIDFFPFTVHYREMAYAAGKIPGGFMKTEGRPSTQEILVARLIDRPIRPLFHQSFRHETQVICTVLSHDSEFSTDILAIIGTSAALAISSLPYQHIIAASKVGFINDEFVLNPSASKLKDSKLDLVVAGTNTSVMMVESEAKVLSEEKMLEAVKFGFESFQPVIKAIEELAAECGKEKIIVSDNFDHNLYQQIEKLYGKKLHDALLIQNKQQRYDTIANLTDEIVEKFSSLEVTSYEKPHIEFIIGELKSNLLRHSILNENVRTDGRNFTQIRPIHCEAGILPKTHGSSLFTRGETQSIVITTLGSAQDAQIVDSLEGEYREHFMLNYIFPPYSVGEVTPLRAPGRREIGHGRLAWRAINPVLPSKTNFPYVIRVVSEITESNGSSSMATVCGASMALMNAGVPISAPVAGIAMGLIKEQNKFVVLSDIIGDEDHLGDMDFKVAGTKEGITALQMDIKVQGINFEIMKVALSQAQEGRLHILEKMNQAISTVNASLSEYAPTIGSIQIDKSKIREVVGTGGKVIKEICESTNSKIEIGDDGLISIATVGGHNLQEAINKIQAIVTPPKKDDVFNGTVLSIIESGAFIGYAPGKSAFLHISEMSNTRLKSVDDVLKVGDSITVKILGYDKKGRVNLTIHGEKKQPSQYSKGKDEKVKKKLIQESKITHYGDNSNPTIDNEKPERKYFD